MGLMKQRGAAALLGIGMLAGLAGCGTAAQEASVASPEAMSREELLAPVPTETASTPTPLTEPEPLPSVEEDGEATCDYILSDPDEFVAVVYLINTGGAPGRAEVTATWKQANGEHVRRSETVDVPVDEPVEVYLSAIARGSQISLHQALPLDKRCSFEVNVNP